MAYVHAPNNTNETNQTIDTLLLFKILRHVVCMLLQAILKSQRLSLLFYVCAEFMMAVSYIVISLF